MRSAKRWAVLPPLLILVATVGSCTRRESGTGTKTVIRVEGSDTMVNLAQAWAEEYGQLHPNVSVQVSGGGSGVGIASLIDGVTDIANASRNMKPKEIERAKQNTGKTPKETVVALDALAIYVHKDNPIESISLKELAEIYGDGGKITTWAQLNVKNVACKSDKITRVGRQNNSGTYATFRDVVLGEGREYKLGSTDQSGSKEVVELVANTPCAIGYSGMGYRTDEVKWLKISKAKGESGIEPSVASVKDATYPIARSLLVYTLGEPTGAVKEYIDWILSDAGQKIVLEKGYVPVHDAGAAPPAEKPSEDPASDPDAAEPKPK